MANSFPNEAVEFSTHGYVGRIPIRNIWLLMLYASDLFRVEGQLGIALEQMPEALPDIIGEILTDAVERRLHRELNSGYCPRRAVCSRVRGRIDLLTTERHQLLARGRVACRFEELARDTTRNRYVRAALERLARLVQRRELANRCRLLANTLREQGVCGSVPARGEVTGERFGPNDINDRRMVFAARLAFDLALPTEEMGKSILPQPEREQTWMRNLFEKAIGGFYSVALDKREWRVRCGEWLHWEIERKTEGLDAVMPKMQTDIVLDFLPESRRIVIDTKFNHIYSSGRFKDETLRSGYIYQIYAYLRSQVGRGDKLADNASGVLLHPAIGQTIDEAVVIQGHCIRFATVDLTASTGEIREQILRLCDHHMTSCFAS